MATVTLNPDGSTEYGGRQRRRYAAKRAAAHARLSAVNRRRSPYASARPHIGLTIYGFSAVLSSGYHDLTFRVSVY